MKRIGENPNAAAESPETTAPALLERVYDELRSIARRRLSSERGSHTLQPTAVVHEAWLRLSELREVEWQSETHFKALAARMMRRVLTDHARARNADKRAGHHEQVTLSETIALGDGKPVPCHELATALSDLAHRSPRQATVVEMRFFAELSWAEIAAAMRVSVETAKRDGRLARAWLNRELSRGEGDS